MNSDLQRVYDVFTEHILNLNANKSKIIFFCAERKRVVKNLIDLKITGIILNTSRKLKSHLHFAKCVHILWRTTYGTLRQFYPRLCNALITFHCFVM